MLWEAHVKKKFGFLWEASFLRAVLETGLLGSASFAGLLSLHTQLYPNVIGQGVLFLVPAVALWCALRLRFPEGDWRTQILQEGAASLVVMTLVAGGWTGLAAALGWEEVLTGTQWGREGMLLLLAASGPAFFGLRMALRFWRFWERLRQRRMLWTLTHTQLMLVLVMVVLVAIVLAVGVVRSQAIRRTEEPTGLPAVVDTFVLTVFPFLSVMVVLTLGLLTAVLPPATVLAFLVARRTTRRLEALVDAAAALREGNYGARVSVSGEDEVAQLQQAFNEMATELQGAVQDLQEQRDRVAALLAARRELVAAVSHELRTPVATLRGYVDSAVGAGDEAEQETLQQDLEVMDGELLRLEGLLEDLFTLSRAEVDGLTLDLQPTDVGEVVHRQVTAIAPLAWQSSRVEVVADVPPALPLACVDEARLAQVLVNLLRNGIRHTPPGGIVAVMVAIEPDELRIEVRDTGEGIPPEELPYIWDRFYRGRRSRDQDGGGAGLGLALVKELTEAMGGVVNVESTFGEGSCFVIHIPRVC